MCRPAWLVALVLLTMSFQTGTAQVLTWTNTSGGAWDLTSLNWTNSSGAAVAWTQSSTTAPLNNAVFGGADGAYTIKIGATQVAASNVTFTASGYTLTNANGANLYVLNSGYVGVSANKTATINAVIESPNNNALFLTNAASSIMNLGGGFGTEPQVQFIGPGTFNLTAGTYGVNTPRLNAATMNQSGGTLNLGGASGSGNWIDYSAGQNATYTINGGTLNLNGTGAGAYLALGRATGTGDTGTLIVQNGGTVNIGTNGVGQISIACDDNSNGKLDVQGGAVTVGTNNGISQIYFYPSGVDNAALTAVMTQEGGTVMAQGIQFGAASGTYAAATASLTLTGGSLYLGNLGLTEGASHAMDTVTFSGGTVGATANWSSAMAVNLGASGGPVTFQAADANNNPNNITLSGGLSGSQGFVKTGGGILSLSGTNTYAGSTAVNAGTLAVATTSTGGGAYNLAANTTLNLGVAGAGASLNMSSFAIGGGTTLDLNPGAFGNPTAPMINVSGALTPGATVTINLATANLSNGQFTLIKYGSLGGSGFGAFTLGNLAGEATLINNTTNDSIDISINGILTWDGTVNGNWDIGVTPNWKTNSYYTQLDGIGPIVTFDDTANGENTNITLNTAVSPAGMLVNNSAKAYSIEGTGTISGPGSLVKEGTNSLVLATTNNYSGQLSSYSTVILGGTLQLGDGLTNNGSVAGTINDGAILAVANPNPQTITNAISGTGMLIKSGAGTITLAAGNTYTGGTTINAGTLVVSAANNVSMPYTNNAGTLQINVISAGRSLAMSNLTFGSANAQLTFNMGYAINLGAPIVNVSGNLAMPGNITVNVTNVAPEGTNILLQCSGTRSGAGNFVAGNLPAGATLVDNRSAGQVDLIYSAPPTVMIPTFNTNELVVSVVTPQEFGARGDGITDDSLAFQNAMNFVGGLGGGVIFVPAAAYAFYTNLTIPQGVTLHGDWTDWTTATSGLEGTTFKVYFGAGQTNAAPFITMNNASTLRGINFWYPNQISTNIVGYPFTIATAGTCVLKNIVLVNSYQGIVAGGPDFIFSTVIGTPLFMGMTTKGTIADVCHSEDIRFSPNVWPASGLSNAPVAGSAYATWMLTYGTGMELFRLDGLLSMFTCISGYNVGIIAETNADGAAGATFYGGSVSNCAIAFYAQEMPNQSGYQFSDFTLDGGIAVERTNSGGDATVDFDHCQIIGRKGTAVYSTGANWDSWMAFQNCTISNTMQLAGPGVFNVVDSTLQGSTQCVVSAGATRAAFTGCTFTPAMNLINQGYAGNLLEDARQSISNAFPIVYWTNVLNDYNSRRPAKTNLYGVTEPAWGAYGNGTNDDTAAIQSALTAAGNNGGGIVYLPAGQYHLTNTVDVPGGVELRGAREMRGAALSVLEPHEGQGTTNGPVALALEANSGVVGVSFDYVAQNTNNYPYPPTIQGRGANVYAIGVGDTSMTTFYYVDLDTYPCLNHLMYMVDGWVLSRGVVVGNGSSGSIVDGHGNGGSAGAVWNYAGTNSQMYTFGDCAELMVEDFSINQNTFVDCISENGGGPNLTGIGAYCDGTTRGFVLDAAGPCEINVVNSTMAIFAIVNAFTNDTVGVTSTTNFQGTARFFNSALFGGPLWDFIVNGGDVGLDDVHMLDVGLQSQVNGGVFHLINNGGYITYHNGSDDFPPYRVTFGTNAGIAGKISELIGSYAYNGYTCTNLNTNNLVNVWLDYALNGYGVLSLTNQFQESHSEPPSLSIQQSPTAQRQGLTVQWPGDLGSLYLYYTPSLAPPIIWTPVTNTPVYSNNQWMVTLPFGTNRCGFYSLQQ